jgi:hypothetical protein
LEEYLIMRQLCLVLLAALAGLGPWIQGSGVMPCCRSASGSAAVESQHGCCSLPAVEVVAVPEPGCCHQAPAKPVSQDEPSAACDCQHAAVQALPAPAPRLDQVLAQAPVLALLTDPLAPGPVRPEAIRSGRGPPPGYAPRAATQYLRSQRLQI